MHKFIQNALILICILVVSTGCGGLSHHNQQDLNNLSAVLERLKSDIFTKQETAELLFLARRSHNDIIITASLKTQADKLKISSVIHNEFLFSQIKMNGVNLKRSIDVQRVLRINRLLKVNKEYDFIGSLSKNKLEGTMRLEDTSGVSSSTSVVKQIKLTDWKLEKLLDEIIKLLT